VRSDNTSGSVYVLPYRDGFRIYFRVGGRLSGTKVFKRRDEADAEADKIRSEVTMRSRSVGSAFDAFVDDTQARGVGENTVERYKRDGRRILGPVLDEPLSVLTLRRADDLYEAIAKSGVYKEGTHHNSLKVARQFGAWCARPKRRWLRVNPFGAVEKIGKIADHRSESYRVEEARAFRNAALELGWSGDVGAVMALVALMTSLGPSEIEQIEARDVDKNGTLLWVAGAELKTENRRREIEIQDPDLAALLAHIANGKAPRERLFPFALNYVARSAARISELLGKDFPVANARWLRRTFSTLSERRGNSLDETAFGMGHGPDPNASTAGRYYSAPGARKSGAAKRVLAVLDDGGVPKKRTRRKAHVLAARPSGTEPKRRRR
jgi:integrase